MSEYSRLEVNFDIETAAALKTAMAEDEISATEAVRRAISVYTYLREQRADGNLIIVTRKDQKSYALEHL